MQKSFSQQRFYSDDICRLAVPSNNFFNRKGVSRSLEVVSFFIFFQHVVSIFALTNLLFVTYPSLVWIEQIVIELMKLMKLMQSALDKWSQQHLWFTRRLPHK